MSKFTVTADDFILLEEFMTEHIKKSRLDSDPKNQVIVEKWANQLVNKLNEEVNVEAFLDKELTRIESMLDSDQEISPRDWQIIEIAKKYSESKSLSAEEVGIVLGISRQMANRIERQAMAKMAKKIKGDPDKYSALQKGTNYSGTVEEAKRMWCGGKMLPRDMRKNATCSKKCQDAYEEDTDREHERTPDHLNKYKNEDQNIDESYGDFMISADIKRGLSRDSIINKIVERYPYISPEAAGKIHDNVAAGKSGGWDKIAQSSAVEENDVKKKLTESSDQLYHLVINGNVDKESIYVIKGMAGHLHGEEVVWVREVDQQGNYIDDSGPADKVLKTDLVKAEPQVVKKESYSIPCANCGRELAPGTSYCMDCDYVTSATGATFQGKGTVEDDMEEWKEPKYCPHCKNPTSLCTCPLDEAEDDDPTPEEQAEHDAAWKRLFDFTKKWLLGKDQKIVKAAVTMNQPFEKLAEELIGIFEKDPQIIKFQQKEQGQHQMNYANEYALDFLGNIIRGERLLYNFSEEINEAAHRCLDCNNEFKQETGKISCPKCGSTETEKTTSDYNIKEGRVTARKYNGDDEYSWAVFVDGRPKWTGLGRSEAQHYRNKEEASLGIKRKLTPLQQTHAEWAKDIRAEREARNELFPDKGGLQLTRDDWKKIWARKKEIRAAQQQPANEVVNKSSARLAWKKWSALLNKAEAELERRRDRGTDYGARTQWLQDRIEYLKDKVYAAEDACESKVNEVIVKKGNQWQVQSHKGKNLGTFSSKADAHKRLGQVEWFKAHKKESINEFVMGHMIGLVRNGAESKIVLDYDISLEDFMEKYGIQNPQDVVEAPQDKTRAQQVKDSITKYLMQQIGGSAATNPAVSTMARNTNLFEPRGPAVGNIGGEPESSLMDIVYKQTDENLVDIDSAASIDGIGLGSRQVRLVAEDKNKEIFDMLTKNLESLKTRADWKELEPVVIAAIERAKAGKCSSEDYIRTKELVNISDVEETKDNGKYPHCKNCGAIIRFDIARKSPFCSKECEGEASGRTVQQHAEINEDDRNKGIINLVHGLVKGGQSAEQAIQATAQKTGMSASDVEHAVSNKWTGYGLKLRESENDMTPDEVKADTLNALQSMKKHANEWSVRDSLRKLTDFGFWQGGAMASIDIDTARDIADAAIKAVRQDSNGNIFNDVYDVVNHYADIDPVVVAREKERVAIKKHHDATSPSRPATNEDDSYKIDMAKPGEEREQPLNKAEHEAELRGWIKHRKTLHDVPGGEKLNEETGSGAWIKHREPSTVGTVKQMGTDKKNQPLRVFNTGQQDSAGSFLKSMKAVEESDNKNIETKLDDLRSRLNKVTHPERKRIKNEIDVLLKKQKEVPEKTEGVGTIGNFEVGMEEGKKEYWVDSPIGDGTIIKKTGSYQSALDFIRTHRKAHGRGKMGIYKVINEEIVSGEHNPYYKNPNEVDEALEEKRSDVDVEVDELKRDLNTAYKAGDKTAVGRIQDRINGLCKIKKEGLRKLFRKIKENLGGTTQKTDINGTFDDVHNEFAVKQPYTDEGKSQEPKPWFGPSEGCLSELEEGRIAGYIDVKDGLWIVNYRVKGGPVRKKEFLNRAAAVKFLQGDSNESCLSRVDELFNGTQAG